MKVHTNQSPSQEKKKTNHPEITQSSTKNFLFFGSCLVGIAVAKCLGQHHPAAVVVAA